MVIIICSTGWWPVPLLISLQPVHSATCASDFVSPDLVGTKKKTELWYILKGDAFPLFYFFHFLQCSLFFWCTFEVKKLKSLKSAPLSHRKHCSSDFSATRNCLRRPWADQSEETGYSWGGRGLKRPRGTTELQHWTDEKTDLLYEHWSMWTCSSSDPKYNDGPENKQNMSPLKLSSQKHSNKHIWLKKK